MTTRMTEKMSGTIPAEKSAKGYVSVVQNADIARTNEGIFAYDGVVYPW